MRGSRGIRYSTVRHEELRKNRAREGGNGMEMTSALSSPIGFGPMIRIEPMSTYALWCLFDAS